MLRYPVMPAVSLVEDEVKEQLDVQWNLQVARALDGGKLQSKKQREDEDNEAGI